MKTLTTAATNSIGKQQRLTIVLDLGDRSSPLLGSATW